MTMTALEERDTIDAGLQRQLETVLFEIAEQDEKTGEAVNMLSEAMAQSEAVAVDDDSLQLDSASTADGGSSADGGALLRSSSGLLHETISDASEYDAEADDALQWDTLDINSQKIEIGPLQRHLASYKKTVLIRLRNTSNISLRLKSGAQLIGGQWLVDVGLRDAGGSMQATFAPPTLIQPRTEVVVVAASRDVFGLARETPAGDLVYTPDKGVHPDQRDTTGWRFRLEFKNLNSGTRMCSVTTLDPDAREGASSAKQLADGDLLWGTDSAARKESHANLLRLAEADSKEFWEVERQVLETGEQYEALFKFIHKKGAAATDAALAARESMVEHYVGFLAKEPAGVGLWQKRWVELRRDSLRYYELKAGVDNEENGPWTELKGEVLIGDVVSIQAEPAGFVHVSCKKLPLCCASTVFLSKTVPFCAVQQQQEFCFAIKCTAGATDRKPYIFAARSAAQRREWVRRVNGLLEQHRVRASQASVSDALSRVGSAARSASGAIGGGGGGGSPREPSARMQELLSRKVLTTEEADELQKIMLGTRASVSASLRASGSTTPSPPPPPAAAPSLPERGAVVAAEPAEESFDPRRTINGDAAP
eukprot:SAG22_NODE_733_length_7580_cov_2.329501_4_plen_596_part_00